MTSPAARRHSPANGASIYLQVPIGVVVPGKLLEYERIIRLVGHLTR